MSLCSNGGVKTWLLLYMWTPELVSFPKIQTTYCKIMHLALLAWITQATNYKFEKLSWSWGWMCISVHLLFKVHRRVHDLLRHDHVYPPKMVLLFPLPLAFPSFGAYFLSEIDFQTYYKKTFLDINKPKLKQLCYICVSIWALYLIPGHHVLI